LSPAATAALIELARREGATLFMTVLAAYQVLLSKWSGQSDMLIGTPMSGRQSTQLEGLIGLFANTLVMRAQPRGDRSFRELLQQVRSATLQAHAHQGLPFERLVQELQPGRDLSRQPLFQVWFDLRTRPAGDLEFAGVRFMQHERELVTTKFDVGLLLTHDARGLHGRFEYATDLFERETLEHHASAAGRHRTWSSRALSRAA
jgi:non-ribosomal peptide synthetase component F